MKKFTITIAVLFIAIACKKKTEKCVWLGMSNGRAIYGWQNTKPSNDQIKKVQDTCFCTLTIEEHCGQTCITDQGGNDIECY